MFAAVGAACASAPGATAEVPRATAALELEGQRVLVLPVQVGTTPAEISSTRATAELVWALRERDARVDWVEPAELRRALARAPAFAADPERLPADPLLHHGERYAAEPLASELRRYAALADARWILLPRTIEWSGSDAAGESRLEVAAALLDARTGNVLWRGSGSAEAPDRSELQRVLVESVSSLAQHLVAVPQPEVP